MKRRLHPAVGIAAMGAIALLYLPMLAMAVLSVNAARHGMRWQGFSLRWYAHLFGQGEVLEAAWNTLVLAVVSTAAATVLGTLLAIGISRSPWPRAARTGFEVMTYLPVVLPDIIFAVALVVAFSALRTVWSIFDPGMLTMILAHVTFQVAFVALVVQSRLATFGATLDEAARDLYASSGYILRRITLPLLAPAIAAGAMLAFTLSLDDFVISFFTYGASSETLPIYIEGELRKGITGEINALSTLIFAVTVLLVLGSGLVLHFARESKP